MNLNDLGWAGMLSDPNTQDSSLVRITSVHVNYLKGISLSGEVNCYLQGKHFFKSENSISVGDWCVGGERYTDSRGFPATIIQSLVPRKSKISRKVTGDKEQVMAANVDYCFIVTSAKSDFNLNRLERYLHVAKAGKVKPIIVLSKVDLVDAYVKLCERLKKRFVGIEILPISLVSMTGLDSIKSIISEPGSTGVVLGSSGVGKSTLVNYIIGESKQSTREVRESDGKGKHTTTSRDLFFLKNGQGMIIDTPGIREVQLLDGDLDISKVFVLIRETEARCKFSDCLHQTEPKCAIKDAIKKELITDEQLQNYLKIKNELEANEKKKARLKKK